jgi:hypothetical protein
MVRHSNLLASSYRRAKVSNGFTRFLVGTINSIFSCVSQIRAENEGSDRGENREEAASYGDQEHSQE